MAPKRLLDSTSEDFSLLTEPAQKKIKKYEDLVSKYDELSAKFAKRVNVAVCARNHPDLMARVAVFEEELISRELKRMATTHEDFKNELAVFEMHINFQDDDDDEEDFSVDMEGKK